MTLQSAMILLYVTIITVLFWRLITQRDDLRKKLWAAEHPYLVGRYVVNTDAGPVWEFQGIFTSWDAALEACKDETYFMVEVRTDLSIPHQNVEWASVIYPKAGKVA